MARGTATVSGAPTRQANDDGSHFLFNGTAAQFITTNTQKLFDLREGLSISVWADLTNADATTRRLVGRSGSGALDDTSILMSEGVLRFRVNVPSVTGYIRSTVSVEATYPMSLISTGRHMITGVFDGFEVRLYIDAVLAAKTDVGYRNYTSSLKRTIDMDGIGGFRLGGSTPDVALNGAMDELMVFDRVLTETEMVAWYRRYLYRIVPEDLVPPTQGRPLSVFGGSFAGSWNTNNANPNFTIGDCSDVAAVFVSLSGTPPALDAAGWQVCQTMDGYLTSPTLSSGANTVYFYYKDRYGNVSAGESITVNYNVPPRPDPVAYWNMDDNTKVGEQIYEPVNQLHAHLMGVLPADFANSHVGRGVVLDGVRKYIRVNHDPIIKPTDELSVSFWLNVPVAVADRSSRTVISTRSATGEGYMFRWSCNTGFVPDGPVTACSTSPVTGTHEFFEFVLRLNNGADAVVEVPQAILGTGTMHIVGTFDGRYMRLYKNASLLRQVDLVSKHTIFYEPNRETPLIIGGRQGNHAKPTGNYFPGLVDEVAVFNRSLYQAHVTDIYTNFIQANQRLFVPALALETTVPSNRLVIYEPGMKSYGTRLRLTALDCAGMNMVLVNNSMTAPSGNDPDWQPCTTQEGAILSAPFPASSTVTPRVWAKTFTGSVATTSGTAHGASYDLPAFARDVPRPHVIWSLDSTFTGSTVSQDIKEHLGWSHGFMDLLGQPDSTMLQLNGLVTVAVSGTAVTGSGTSFTSQLSVGDRIRIAGETVQIKAITNDTSLEIELPHLAGATLSTSYRVGKIYDAISAIEGGYDFNGINDVIFVKPTGATNPFYNVSISAWVELKKGETLHRHIVGNNQNTTSASGRGVGLKVQGGQLRFYVTARRNTPLVFAYYEVGIDTNLYNTGLHHVTGTYDGRDLKLYLDGVFVKNNAIPLYGAANFHLEHDDFSYWTIGAEAGEFTPSVGPVAAPASYFNGVIDEINVWHSALTEQEVYYVYEFGAARLPTAVTDGIPPTDPGIYITSGQTTQSSPWTLFTMPSCVGANGREINAIFVSTSPTPPARDAIGWQFCSQDAGYIISQLLDRGTTTLYVYFRDEEGDVTGSPGFDPTEFTVTYIPPTMVHPLAYYTFDGDSTTGDRFLSYDSAGTKHIRATYHPYSPFAVGKRGTGWRKSYGGSENFYPSPLDQTYRAEFNSEKNFAVAFWYNTLGSQATVQDMVRQGQYVVRRTTGDNVQVLVRLASWPNEVTVNSAGRLKDQAWNHVGVSRDGSSLRLYINGRLDSSHVIPNINLSQHHGVRFLMAEAGGIYDELVMFSSALTNDQMAYVFFKGEKNESIDLFEPNYVAPKVPDLYWNFDDAFTAAGYLNPVRGSVPLRLVNAVTPGQTNPNARVQEAYFFQRFEDVLEGAGETANTVGPQQYLESDSAAPVSFPADFTISLWVRQPQAKGHNTANANHIDSTAILDLWGADDFNKSLQLSYFRGAAAPATTQTYYTLSFRNNNANIGFSTNTSVDPLAAQTGWVHLAIRRKGRDVSLYLNGLESASTTLLNDFGLAVPRFTRLRVGNSSLYSFYQIPGTVTVAPGSTSVTGTGTQFLTDLFTLKSGTITVAPGSTTVTGTGTDFFTELPGTNVQIIKIGSTFHTVASVTSATSLTLATPHVAGVTDAPFRARHMNAEVRIGLQNFTIASIGSDTSLTLSAPHTLGVTNQKLAININANGALAQAYDEHGLNGYVDELAVWQEALTQRQIYNLTLAGNAGQAIPVEPIASLVSVNGSNVVNTTAANFVLNDCGGYTHVWIGRDGDVDPLLGDGGWVACVPGSTYSTGALIADSSNSIKVWFKDAVAVSTHTTGFVVVQATGDTQAPIVNPADLVMVTPASPSTTSDSFARFTLANCADVPGPGIIAGVYIGPSGPAPAANASAWQNCTTSVAGLVSQPLVSGVNSISVWFKDVAGNVSASMDFSVTYVEPVLPASLFSLTFDNTTVNTTTHFIKDIVVNELGKGFNTAGFEADRVGTVAQAVAFSANSYYDFAFSELDLNTTLSVFSWVNVSASASDSHIIGRWNGDPNEDSWALRVDSTGRVCLDAQTTASTGVWNTSTYKRMCSSAKIAFAKWQHIGVTRNGSTVQFFIDGKLSGSDSMNGLALKDSTLSLRVGAQDRGGVASPVIGLLDELHVWDVVLTAQQREAALARGLKGQALFTEPGPVDPAILPDHYWRFETGSVLAASYGGVNFTANTGAVVATATPIVGDYMSFTAPATPAQVISTSAFALNLSSDFTISLWVRPTTLTASDLISKWNTAQVTEQEMRLSTTAGGLVVFHYRTSTPTVGSLTSVESLPVNAWSHIAVTRKGAALYLFINGRAQNVANIGASGILNVSGNGLSVGGNAINAAAYFNGGIDDLVIYKSYLNERKLRFNINKGLNDGDPVAP